MLERLKKINRGLLELIAGILFLGMVCLIIGSFIVKEPLLYAIALLAGILLALITAYHMYRTLDRALNPGVDASKVVTAASLVRYVCIVLVFVVILMTDKLNPLVTFLGLMCLKAAAYMQPLTHKVCNKIFHEVDPIPQPLVEPTTESEVEALAEPLIESETESAAVPTVEQMAEENANVSDERSFPTEKNAEEILDEVSGKGK